VSKLIPFNARQRRRETAAYALALSARWQRLNKGKPSPRPDRPEHLGNMLQRLTVKQPAVVLALTNLIADMLEELDQEQ